MLPARLYGALCAPFTVAESATAAAWQQVVNARVLLPLVSVRELLLLMAYGCSIFRRVSGTLECPSWWYRRKAAG